MGDGPYCVSCSWYRVLIARTTEYAWVSMFVYIVSHLSGDHVLRVGRKEA